MKSRPIIALASILLAAALASGCSPLKYRFSPREQTSVYLVEIESGKVEESQDGKRVDVPNIPVASYNIRLQPKERVSGNLKLELNAEYARGKLFSNTTRLGSETLILSPKGKLVDEIGIPVPIERRLLFPKLPEKRGREWTVKEKKKILLMKKPVKWKYKHAGRGKGVRRGCRLIDLNIGYNEQADRAVPGGPTISYKAAYTMKGDICFARGRLRDAVYREEIVASLSAPGIQDRLIMKHDYTLYRITWKGKQAGK